MHWVQISRLAVLSAVSFFALIVIAVNGHYINITLNTILLVDGFIAWPQSSPDTFSAFTAAVAALTFLSLPLMVAIDFMRRGAFTSMIIFELGWLAFLWVLWLTAAAYTASSIGNLLDLCSINPIGHSNLHSACKDTQASAAFGFLSWLALSGYLVLIIVLCIMSQRRGTSMWYSTVADLHVNNFPKPGGLPMKDGLGSGSVDTPMNYYQSPNGQAPMHPYPPSTSPAAATPQSYGGGQTMQSPYPQV